ncbi:MAG: hypothetical protein IT290_05620, partial [Deltaproteobacteria bacterium]|nr:hypothetical protein [Deltaproteobacteria bacterium]
FHGDEVSLVTGDFVIGLYRKEQAFELREVVVTITPVRDEIVDSEEERTGKRLDVPDAENALLLLPKSIGLSAGPVAGVAPDSEEISIGGTIEVSNDRRLLVTGRAAIEEGLELSDVSLWLACEGSNSVESYLELLKFETLDSSGLPRVGFRGDVDRDGKSDLLISFSPHYNRRLLHLFLSSQTRGACELRKAGEFSQTGC